MGQNITKMSASECADDLIVRDAEKFANLNKSKKDYQNGKDLKRVFTNYFDKILPLLTTYPPHVDICEGIPFQK